MERTSFSISEEELEEINSHLEYGDNRSAWIRDAVRLKLEILEVLEEDQSKMSTEERRKFIVDAVHEVVDE